MTRSRTNPNHPHTHDLFRETPRLRLRLLPTDPQSAQCPSGKAPPPILPLFACAKSAHVQLPARHRPQQVQATSTHPPHASPTQTTPPPTQPQSPPASRSLPTHGELHTLPAPAHATSAASHTPPEAHSLPACLSVAFVHQLSNRTKLESSPFSFGQSMP